MKSIKELRNIKAFCGLGMGISTTTQFGLYFILATKYLRPECLLERMFRNTHSSKASRKLGTWLL